MKFCEVCVAPRDADATHMANAAVRPHDSFRKVESGPARKRLFNFLRYKFPILRVYKTHIFLGTRRLTTSIQTVDLKQFGRPVVKSKRVEYPATRVSKPLAPFLSQVELC